MLSNLVLFLQNFKLKPPKVLLNYENGNKMTMLSNQLHRTGKVFLMAVTEHYPGTIYINSGRH